MCPLYPFHVIILYLCLILPLLFAVIEGADELAGLKLGGKWNLTFTPNKIHKLQEYNSTEVQLSCHDCPLPSDFDPGSFQLALKNEKPDLASIDHTYNEVKSLKDGEEEIVFDLRDLGVDSDAGNWSLMFNISGKFLGFSSVKAEVRGQKAAAVEVLAEKKLPVAIVRKKTIQSKLFAYSVAILISLAYINMGCALDMEVVKKTLKRPVGPAIGFICQFMVMPLLSYVLGFIFGVKSAPMRLGLFVTGTSPGGGASNIWTVMFGGNLDLSVTMTAVSTFSAFFMMPLWIFTLGKTIFDESDIVIPYYKICIYAFFLVVPLSMGLAISRFAPKVSNFLVRILKPLALFLILFIIIFGVWANLYIFKLMTWQVLVTGMGLPWLGFSLGFLMAKICNRPIEDVIAIAIETGVQNTGMSIFILWFTLDHPLGDLTAVIPVAAATMTPIPLLAALIVLKVRECVTKEKFIGVPSSAGGKGCSGDNDYDGPIIKIKDVNGMGSESKQALVNDKSDLKGDPNENDLA